MKRLTQDELRAYLRAHDVRPAKTIENIISGFDFRQPVYEQPMEPGQELFQFIRNVSHSERSPRTGNWFALASARMAGLAIFGGGAGRHLHRFVVNHEFTAIEGTAGALPPDWGWAGGGPGGHTQIYVPPKFLGHLGSLGPQ